MNTILLAAQQLSLFDCFACGITLGVVAYLIVQRRTTQQQQRLSTARPTESVSVRERVFTVGPYVLQSQPQPEPHCPEKVFVMPGNQPGEAPVWLPVYHADPDGMNWN